MSGAAPLAGVRVLDLSRILAGPYCSMVLADLGADVIKVEDARRGDDTRAWGPPFQGGEGVYFLSVNRNKRSLAVDLKNPTYRDAVCRLAADADIVVENFRPGTAARLGLGYVRSRRRTRPSSSPRSAATDRPTRCARNRATTPSRNG